MLAQLRAELRALGTALERLRLGTKRRLKMEGVGQGCSTGQGRRMLGVWDPPWHFPPPPGGSKSNMWDNPTSSSVLSTGRGATHTAQHHGGSPGHRAPHCSIPTLYEGTAFPSPLLSFELLPQLPANLKTKGRWRQTLSCSVTAAAMQEKQLLSQGHAAIPFQQLNWETGNDFVSFGRALSAQALQL